MTPHRKKVIAIVLGSLVGLVIILGIAGVWVAQSSWFHEYVRQRIIQAVQESTGGRVEVGQFRFDWRHLRAEIRQFVLHGTEPADQDPFFRAQGIIVELRVLSLVRRRRVDIALLDIREPRASVIVYPNGRTNIPRPNVGRSGDKTALETLVDLAIGRFNVENGSLRLADQETPFSIQGENLTVQLAYEIASGQYRGQISMNPVLGQYAQNKRTSVNLSLGVVLGKDRIELIDATMASANSNFQVRGALEHLAAPQITGRAVARIDLTEMRDIFGSSFPISVPNGSPRMLDAQIDATGDDKQIRIASAKLVLGQSSLDASGTFRNLKLEEGSIEFRAQLVLAELARIVDPAIQAGGELELGGRARLNGVADYHVDAALAGSNMAFRRGRVNLSNIRLSSKIAADPIRIDLNPFTAQMGPGQVTGNATVENLAAYRLRGNLNRLDIAELISIVTSKRVEYAGTLSGPLEMTGDLKRMNSMRSTARLNIIPGRNGVPISGNLNVDYDGPRDTVNLRNSYIALPASRLDLSGTLGTQVDVHLVSRNLEDFRPALALLSEPPAQFPAQLEQGGSATIDAKIVGQISAPNITGHVAVTRFRVEQRHFDQLIADIRASNSQITVNDASLRRNSLVAAFQGVVGLNQWAIKPASPVTATATIQNGDVLDVLAFAGQTNLPLSGELNVDARVSGTIGDPQGSARLRVTKGMAYGEPLELAEGEVTYGGQKISIPSLRIESGTARANLNATFEHPPEKFSEGAIRVHVDSNQVALARLHAIQSRIPNVDGNVQVNLDADLAVQPVNGDPQVRVVAVNGTVEGRGMRRQGRNLGDATARVQTSGSKLAFRLVSDFAGSKIEADGETDLVRDYETSANVNIQDLPIADVLAVAGHADLAASGLLSAKGDVAGTLADPRANLDFTLTKAVVQRQPFDRVEGHVAYTAVLMELKDAQIQTGTSRIDVSGSFAHPLRDFTSGDVKLKVQSSQVQLSQIVYLQERKPGLSGTLQLSMDSVAKLNPAGTATRVAFSSLNARASATGVSVQGRDYGSFTATAAGTGSTVTANVESDLAQSSIKADVKAELTGDYPASGQIKFSEVRYVNWAGLLGTGASRPNFDALLEGSATFSGPVLKLENLTGTAELTKAELFAAPTEPATRRADLNVKDLALKNDGPVTVVADRSGVQVKRARWIGPSTQVSVSGNVVLQPLAFNLDVKADADLAILHRIRDDISSAGKVQLNASIKGPLQEPTINGRVELREAAFQTSDMPNGISKATGVIVFAGTTATIQSLTAESGGGRLTVTGTVFRLGGQTAYNLGLRANRVQVRTDSGASVGVNADLKLNGTQQAGVLSGNVTIRNVSFNPRSDLGTMLAETADPAPTPATPGGFMAGTRLDLTIKTAAGASFQSVYTTSLDANADLTMRGTLANPGMLGRVTVSSGELVFFGTKYKLDSGNVSFFNPTKIEPILDLNLATTARGVQVTLSVTGPIQNMNLAYQSDPPLQFSEIVGLLAAGRMPTSDPVLLARQPAVQPQSFQQMGESAILNKVVTNPVSGQLKRVFGVTELKIDPTFTSGSELPQARLTLQQSVTKQLSFTYITNLTRADSQILRAEWALNQRWSAVATRQENGLVGIDLFYKRRIR